MARYIDADLLIKDLKDCTVYRKKDEYDPYINIKSLIRYIECLPTANVTEVKCGKWIDIADFGDGNCFGRCSACKTIQTAKSASVLKASYKYCPWCGVRMVGAQNLEG